MEHSSSTCSSGSPRKHLVNLAWGGFPPSAHPNRKGGRLIDSREAGCYISACTPPAEAATRPSYVFEACLDTLGGFVCTRRVVVSTCYRYLSSASLGSFSLDMKKSSSGLSHPPSPPPSSLRCQKKGERETERRKI